MTKPVSWLPEMKVGRFVCNPKTTVAHAVVHAVAHADVHADLLSVVHSVVHTDVQAAVHAIAVDNDLEMSSYVAQCLLTLNCVNSILCLTSDLDAHMMAVPRTRPTSQRLRTS